VIHIRNNDNGFSFNVKIQLVFSLLSTKRLLSELTAALSYHKIGVEYYSLIFFPQ